MLLKFISLVGLTVVIAFAQPYLYHHYSDPFAENPPTQIVRFNASTGMKEPFYVDSSYFGSYEVLDDEQSGPWIILLQSHYNSPFILNTLDTSKHVWLPDSGEFVEWSYNSKFKKIIYYYLSNDTSGNRRREWVIDENTLAIVRDEAMDQERLPTNNYSIDGSKYVARVMVMEDLGLKVSTSQSEEIIRRRKLFEIGDPKKEKWIEDIKNGIVLMTYRYPTNNESNETFLVYDPFADSVLCKVKIGYREEMLFSSDGKYILVEEKPWRTVNTDPKIAYISTGTIHIYDSHTGSQLATVQATPRLEGKMYVFSQFPDKIFYIDKSAEGWNWTSEVIDIRAAVSGKNPIFIALKNNNGALLPGGTLQYYDGSWKDAVNNNNGTFSITTTKTSLSLRMTYGFASQTRNNVAVGSDTIVFQTVNAAVQLRSSAGEPLDTGTVQYYAGAWRPFGTTVNGVATKELLPVNYSFRMTYGFAGKDTAQDLSQNQTVTFTTVKTQVQLKNSENNPLDQGTVQYYAGAWRPFGTTSNGITAKELLPNSYSFRMTYGFAGNDKVQHTGSNPFVTFNTVKAQVQLKNSSGSFLDTGTVQYYAGAWRSFGSTANGLATKELLPNAYSFRMTYANISNDSLFTIGVGSPLVFSTVPATINVKNLQNYPVNNATVSYYAGAPNGAGWRTIGATSSSGEITKELLPASIPFRAKSGMVTQDKTQHIGANPQVNIQLNIAQ